MGNGKNPLGVNIFGQTGRFGRPLRLLAPLRRRVSSSAKTVIHSLIHSSLNCITRSLYSLPIPPPPPRLLVVTATSTALPLELLLLLSFRKQASCCSLNKKLLLQIYFYYLLFCAPLYFVLLLPYACLHKYICVPIIVGGMWKWGLAVVTNATE